MPPAVEPESERGLGNFGGVASTDREKWRERNVCSGFFEAVMTSGY